MNVYDFDGTLYKGESCLHFAIFCIIRKPKVLLFIPQILTLYKRHKNNKLDMNEANKLIKKILDTISTTEKEFYKIINDFWLKHEKNLNFELINQMEENDLILSAGPNILLEASPIKHKNILCSKVDLKKKELLFFCYGENKRKLFKKKFKNKKINKFYTDSYSDMPLMELAKEVYLVKNGKGLGNKINFKKGES